MESFAADERVGLGKELVLDADPGDVEVAVAGIAIYEYGQLRGVGSAFEHLEHLGPERIANT
jgi:hypothetical protein